MVTRTRTAAVAKPAAKKPAPAPAAKATTTRKPVARKPATSAPVEDVPAATPAKQAFTRLHQDDLDLIIAGVGALLAERFSALTDQIVALATPAPIPSNKGTAKASTKAADEPADDADVYDADARTAVLNKASLAKLKTTAVELGYTESELAGFSKAQIADLIVEAEAADAADEGKTVVGTVPSSDDDAPADEEETEEDSEEEDEEEESEEDEEPADDEEEEEAEEEEAAEEEDEEDDLPSREELMDSKEWPLSKLKKFAADNFDMSGLDGFSSLKKREPIVDYILGSGDEEEEETEEEGLTQEELEAMSLAELRKVYAQYVGKKPAPNMKQAQIIKAIVDTASVPF